MLSSRHVQLTALALVSIIILFFIKLFGYYYIDEFITNPQLIMENTNVKESDIEPDILEKVYDYLDQQNVDNRNIIIRDITKETFGYVFIFVPYEYAHTHNPKYLIPGLSPVVYNTVSQEIIPLSTSVSPDKAVEIYKKSLLMQ